MKIFPSNCGNCFAMNSFAIGVDEPQITLSIEALRDRRLHERRGRVGREVEDDAAALTGVLDELEDDRVGVGDGQR